MFLRKAKDWTRGAAGPPVLAATVLTVLVAPFALATGEGGSLRAGARNPNDNQSSALVRETEIIADSDTYGTRQSNKRIGDGGGAIYGCRSVPGREPCVRANNLNTGRAFEFTSRGLEGGRIELTNSAGRPFSTNATGVATNLNADRVDNRNADDFLLRTAKAADADQLDGRDSAQFVGTGDLLFAAVNSVGALGANRGAAAAALANPVTFTYAVTFTRNISACSYTASPTGDSSAEALGVSSADANTVNVDAAGPTGFHLQVIC